MTDQSSLLQPFVWLNVVTPESPSKRQVIPLTGSVLVSFTDETVFDIDSAPGGERSKTGRARVRFNLFDANYTYLETLFLLNKRRMEVEYGWLDSSGNIATSSGIIPVTITSIKPKFTYQGTELEVIAASDFSSCAPTGSIEHFYATHTFSISFIPESNTNPYLGKYPHADFAKAATQKKKEEVYYNDTIGANGPQNFDLGPTGSDLDVAAWTGGGSSEIAQNAKNLDEAKAAKLEDKNFKYRSISDLVKSIAKSMGMKSDVDDTKIAPPDALFTFTGMTIMNILSGLAIKAESDDGYSDYGFWIRGDTLYFKRVTPKEKFNRVFNYGVGIGLQSSASGNSESKDGIVLGVEIDIQPNLLANSAWVQTVTASVDATNKAIRGGNVLPPYKKVKDIVDASIVRGVTKRELGALGTVSFATAEFVPPEGMTIATAVQAEEGFYSQDWLMWDLATKIADETIQSLKDKIRKDQQFANTRVDGSSVNYQELFSQSRILAYGLLKKERDERILATGDPSAEIEASTSLIDAATEQNQDTESDIRKTDPTLAGRLYTTPLQNSASATWAKAISNAAGSKVFKAKMIIVGDVNIRPFNIVTLNLLTLDGPHYASGDYRVIGVNNVIDASGFTSELSLVNDGGIRATAALKATSIPNEKYRPSNPKPVIWTDVPTAPSPFTVKDDGPEDAAEDKLILDDLLRKGTRPK